MRQVCLCHVASTLVPWGWRVLQYAGAWQGGGKAAGVFLQLANAWPKSGCKDRAPAVDTDVFWLLHAVMIAC